MAAVFETWWLSIRHPLDIWQKHPSFLICELFVYISGLLLMRHAYRHGGRYPYIWLSTVLHGLTVESVSYFLPDIDNFWHAQSMVMLLGKRLPLHIIFVYPLFLYTAFVSVSRLHLKKWAEPLAMGLAVVLIDIPFDIMGIKLLWWTWHDTDPNIYDRMYWVPWTSYYFHATFASSLNFLFHATRRLLTSTPGYQSDSWPKEMVCCVLVGLFSMPMGVLQFIPIYHGLHDAFHIHSEVCVLMLLTMYVLIVWVSDRNPDRFARNRPKGFIDEISVTLVFHYLLYIFLVIFEQPEKNRSFGLHEKVGDCNATTIVMTAVGQELSKKTYLCLKDYSEDYFDFHCTQNPPPGADNYEVCGTPYPNHMEYIAVVTSFCALGLFIFFQILFFSGKPHGGASKAKKAKTN